MRWPNPRGAFSPNDPGRNLWFVRDPVDRIRQGLGRGCAILRRIGKSPVPPGGLPRARR